ncbi:hypothetical protein [Macrococcus armenti]|uniref:Tetratricopeptide repeat protein n=1 Tax=Macrococcus armenti TaxID=2875764 RepID=A0ABY3ZSI0_9STAP|nr:hypothetical protein [Macrococcus armenti]UOB19849.1 hypothetical protein MRZ06_07320 [Macrococcus armenti]
MSDIIIFPKLQDHLRRQIKQAMKSARYEDAYDLFNALEKHFELSEDDQLLKLDCLYALASYLELREEASILLNQGHPAYNKIVPYFIECLIHYKQYQTVIELIDALRQENVDHKLLMTLMPFYDEASEGLATRRKVSRHFIQTFKDDDKDAQCTLIIKLIQSEDFAYQVSFIHILESSTLHPVVITFILQYLMMANNESSVKVHKLSMSKSVKITHLTRLEQTPFQNIMNQVETRIEEIMPSVKPHVSMLMKQHQLIMYPFESEYFDASEMEVVAAYTHFILNLFGFEQSDDLGNSPSIDIMSKIEQLEKLNR